MAKILTQNGNEIVFEETELYFDKNTYSDLFVKKNNKTLFETIKNKKYNHLEKNVCENYSKYLDMKLGLFLKQLKDNKDSFYKNFLNQYGDCVFSKFKIIDKKILSKKGLYIYCVNDELKYIGRSKDPFEKRINNGYGRISPKNCFLDGQSTNCHINSLITKNKDIIHLFVLQLKSDILIESLEKDLIEEYSQKNKLWNKQLNKEANNYIL